ncbi:MULTISPECIES: MATE family efflux transporter [unclassified Mycobacterium]|uniref:MATE family efflux transporter n=1 Tax=unclassified Mycobacterium TaxID=2642494 RepID=UPI0029C66FAD|nr:MULTISPECIES: MATE family efflux transporter [unclassified Mycobacterium]
MRNAQPRGSAPRPLAKELALNTIRAALRLSGLAAIALLAEPLTGVADTVLAGSLGVDEQSSLALGTGIATTATWLVTPILFAQTTEVARLRAAGRRNDAARTTRHGLVSAVVFGLALSIALGAVAVLADFGTGARGYLLARAVGLPVMALVMAGYGALRGSNAVPAVSVLALSGAGVHVLLDIVSVAWTTLGVTAFGVASTLSQLVVACLLLLVMRARGLLTRGSTDAMTEPPAWRKSVGAVLVLAVRSAALGAATIAMTGAAVGIGPVAGAAHQVTYQFWLLVVLAVEGWKSAAQILVSSTTSMAERHRVESSLLRSSVVLGCVAGLATLALMPVVVDAMSADGAVAHVARSIWALSAVSLVFGTVAYTRDGIEFGRGAYVANLVRTLAGTLAWFVGAWVSHATGDLRWIWCAVPAGLVIRMVLPFRTPVPCIGGATAHASAHQPLPYKPDVANKAESNMAGYR